MIFVIFQNLATYLAFRAAIPENNGRLVTALGDPAYESMLPDESPDPEGRVFLSHNFSADEAAYLQELGAEVRIGSLDGPLFGAPSEM